MVVRIASPQAPGSPSAWSVLRLRISRPGAGAKRLRHCRSRPKNVGDFSFWRTRCALWLKLGASRPTIMAHDLMTKGHDPAGLSRATIDAMSCDSPEQLT